MVVRAQLLETFLNWSSAEKLENEISTSKRCSQSELRSRQARDEAGNTPQDIAHWRVFPLFLFPDEDFEDDQ